MKFTDLQLHPILQKTINEVGFSDCTEIQTQAIPVARTGRDVAGLAQTGTGKTAAFLLPIIDRLLKELKPDPAVEATPTKIFGDWKRNNFVLVLVPTRELAEQVQENATKFLAGTGLSSVSVYGGTTYDKQVAGLKAGVEFVIATPGRLIDLFKENVCDLSQVRAVVFDEADRMFDMGFKDDMKFVLKRIPKERQFLVFSATLNFDVLNTAYEFGADPVEVSVSRDQAKADNVKDSMLHLGNDEKPQYLLSLIKKHEPRQAIIFCNYKHNVEKLVQFLNSNDVPAVGISSLLTQAQRTRVMAQFKAENDRNILVATDVAARGLDILGVDMVINFDLPDDPENYVHRIGRTGRAGATGQALSMVSDRDVDALQRVEEYLKHKVDVVWLDEAEIIKDFKPVPRGDDYGRRPHASRDGERQGRSGGRDGGRSGGRDGGRDQNRQDRRPRRDAEPRRDDRGPRPANSQSEGGRPPQREAQRNGEAPRDREAHRDRNRGRHSASEQNSAHRQNPNSSHDRRPLNRPPQRSASPTNGSSRAVPSRSGVKVSLGAKVTGFFKKLFAGGEPKNEVKTANGPASPSPTRAPHYVRPRSSPDARHEGRDGGRQRGRNSGGRPNHNRRPPRPRNDVQARAAPKDAGIKDPKED